MMTLGAILLLAAALLAGAALAAPGRWRLLLARAHATAVLLAFAVMLVAFLAGDLGYAYVWDHTRQDYALPYKLAGLWGGEEGTLLLWNAAVAAFLVLVLRKEGALHRRAAGFLLAMGGALALVNLLAGAFDATDPAKLALAPQGRGLADVLLTPLMVIHPPVQFVGYALMAVPAAYALAGWWGPERDDRSWAGPAFRWARVAWLFATLGLGLGALWAYYVLSFGGYWAWDPVETSNLLPWLALTAFLHAGKGLTQRGDHPVAAPLLAFGAHALTLFATFATRSGLWVSVHAFTDPTNRFEPDAGLRLLAILGASPESRLLLGLLTATVLSGMALFALRHARGWGLRLHAALLLALAGAAALDPAFVWGLALQAGSLAPFGLAILAALLLGAPPVAVFLRADESRRKLALDQRTLLSIAVALLAIGLAVALLLDVQVVNGPDRRLFDERAPVLVLPVIAALTLVLSVGPLGKRGATLLAGAGFLGGVAGFLLFPQARVLALAAPPLAAALAAALLKLAHVQGPAGGARLKAAGLLSGIASLLGLALWGNPPTWVSGLAIPEGLSLALGFVGVALSALGLAGAFVAWRGRAYPLALAGSLASALTLGYGVGLAMGLAAAALVVAERRRFEPPRWRSLGARLRETGVYALHLALLLGLLGYAASTYSQDRQVFAAEPMDARVGAGGHAFALAAAQTRTDASGGLASVEVPIQVDSGGAIPLSFSWSGNHYAGDLHVRRALLEDVYVTPLAFHTSAGWVGANSAGTEAPAGAVDAVSFSVSVLPMVGLVWAGLWGMLLGMLLVLVGARLEGRGRRVPVAQPEEPLARAAER